MSDFSDEQKAFLLALGRINYLVTVENETYPTPQDYVDAVETESKRILNEILHA